MCIVYKTPDVDLVTAKLEGLGFTKLKLKHIGNVNMFFRGNIGHNIGKSIGRVHIRVSKETKYNDSTDSYVHEVFTYRYRGDRELRFGVFETGYGRDEIPLVTDTSPLSYSVVSALNSFLAPDKSLFKLGQTVKFKGEDDEIYVGIVIGFDFEKRPGTFEALVEYENGSTALCDMVPIDSVIELGGTVEAFVVPTVAEGYQRQWYRCNCGAEQYIDFVPYSLSNPIIETTCGHDLKRMVPIDEPSKRVIVV